MKKRVLAISLATLIVLALINGCKKDDKELNAIVIAGNEYPNINGTFVPVSGTYYAPGITACNYVKPLYFSAFYIKLDNDATLYLTFYSESDSDIIPTGTFNAGESCEPGFIGLYSPATTTKAIGLRIESGTVTISRKGTTYDADIDGTFAAADGGGTIKGNFNGVPVIGERS